MDADSLATIHTASVRLRDALNRWLVAFDHLVALTRDVSSLPPLRAGTKGKPASEASATLIKLARRLEGVTSVEAAVALGIEVQPAAARLCMLCKRGLLVRVESPFSSNGRFRYFADEALADAWASTGAFVLPAVAQAMREGKGARVGRARAARAADPPLAWLPGAPAHSKPVPPGSAAISSGAIDDDEGDRGRARRLAGQGDAGVPRQRGQADERERDDRSAAHDAGLLRALDDGNPRQGNAERVGHPPPAREIPPTPKAAGKPPAPEPVVPDNVRRIVMPPVRHDPRYQCDPEEQVQGGFLDEWRRLRGGAA